MESSKKVVIGVGIALAVILVILCICLGLFLLFGGGAVWRGANEGPQEIEISVDAPHQVKTGEEFTVEVTLENLADDAQLLYSIDFTDDYLQGIDVVSTFPDYEEMNAYEMGDFRSYMFEREIDAGEELVVRIQLVGQAEGAYSGEMDVCVDDGFRCETVTLSTLVQP
ncbi:MAG: hypothetical protein JXB38_12695 [Anaerolineales bacterium]|nr:hypothetical protein [Anaerolineales bacterium]